VFLPFPSTRPVACQGTCITYPLSRGNLEALAGGEGSPSYIRILTSEEAESVPSRREKGLPVCPYRLVGTRMGPSGHGQTLASNLIPLPRMNPGEGGKADRRDLAMRADQSRSREITTDLYELTMAASYFEQGMFAPATFSLFVRHYPPNRS